jgi:lipopolysaccharide export system permease protein
MKILDWYILKQFLINFVILLFVFSLLFVAVNVLVDLDEFIEAGRANPVMGNKLLGTFYAVIDFNGPMVVLLFVYFSGLIAVAAMGFTFAGLYRTGELTAMVTNGISMFRIAAPIIFMGGILNMISLPVQEYAIPPMAPKILRTKGDVKLQTINQFEVRYVPDDDRRKLLSASEFDYSLKRMRDVVILERGSEHMASARVTAASAVWDAARNEWVLTNGYRIYREAGAGTLRPEAGAVGRRESVPTYALNISPEVLLARRQGLYARLLSFGEVQSLMQNEIMKESGQTDTLRQIMHSRFSLLVVNMLVLVMGLPFFLLREPVNMLLQGVKASAVCLGAWCMAMVFLQVGAGELNPVLTAWLPVIPFLPLAAWMVTWIKT